MHSRLSQKAGFLSLRSRCPNVVIPFDRVERSFRDQCSLTPPGWGYYHIESTRRLTEMNRTIMSCCDLPNPVLWTWRDNVLEQHITACYILLNSISKRYCKISRCLPLRLNTLEIYQNHFFNPWKLRRARRTVWLASVEFPPKSL